MANENPVKPKKSHPWRNCASSKVVSWAREQSQIRDVTNVSVARAETLHRRDKRYEGGAY